MRSLSRHGRGLAGGIVSLALLAGLWLVLAPLQVGGSTSYVLITGTSMEPGLHAGNLVLARAQRSYAVGDAVLYRSSTLGRPVLHRILAIQDGRYSFKGDNNNFVDPGSEASSAIVGIRWARIPWAGTAVGWLTTPLHAGLFGGLAALFALLGGGTGVRLSRRHQHRQRRAAEPAPAELAPAHGAGGPGGPGLDRLAGSSLGRTVGVLATLLALGGLLLVVGFTRPTQRSAALADAYVHTGRFLTVGTLIKPNPAYPTGFVVTGQPFFFSLVRFVAIRFEYHFTSKLPHAIHGTISLGSTVAADTTYSQHFPIVAARAFTGDTAVVEVKADIQLWKAFFSVLAADSGQSNAEFRIIVQPIVKVSGVVLGTPINETFQPAMTSIATTALIKLSPATPTPLPGAPYKPTIDPLVATLNPAQAGSIPTRVTNHIHVLRYSIAVVLLRVAGIAATLLALLGLLVALLTRKHVGKADDDELILAHYGALIVPTEWFERADGPPQVKVESFSGLVRISQTYQQLILREPRCGHYRYGVEAEGRLYTFDPDLPPADVQPPPVSPGPPLPPSAVAAWPATGRSRRRRWPLLPAAVAVAVVAACALSLGFTASNTVPDTRIGVSVFPVTLDQLAPSQCAGMTFDGLHAATKNSTDGTKERDLILGRDGTGKRNYNGKQGADCIVAGGGPGTENEIDGGGGGDICIGAPGARNTFKNCAVTYN